MLPANPESLTPSPYGAIMNAIADAIGDEIFRKSPVSPDMILEALENGGKRIHDPLTAHI